MRRTVRSSSNCRQCATSGNAECYRRNGRVSHSNSDKGPIFPSRDTSDALTLPPRPSCYPRYWPRS